MNPFSPCGDTSSVTAGTTGNDRAAIAAGGKVARVYNAGAAVAYIKFGNSAVTAALATGLPVAPGSVELFSIAPNTTHMAAIVASGTGVVFVTPGGGI